jgi:hypothetical protein
LWCGVLCCPAINSSSYYLSNSTVVQRSSLHSSWCFSAWLLGTDLGAAKDDVYEAY